jgi:hypothetical protein
MGVIPNASGDRFQPGGGGEAARRGVSLRTLLARFAMRRFRLANHLQRQNRNRRGFSASD